MQKRIFCRRGLTITALWLCSCSSSPHQPNRDIAQVNNVSESQIIVNNQSAGSYDPEPLTGPVKRDAVDPDVVIVGGGLSGLSAAVYLNKAHLKVLVLEKESSLGGLAASSTFNAHAFDRGAAYWTSAYQEEAEILKEINLGDYEQRNPIPDPIDSYFVRGKYYSDIWTDKTLAELPASFSLFKFELKQADADSLIPNQPFEEFEKYDGKMDLDTLTAREWIEAMPKSLKNRLNKWEKNQTYENTQAQLKNKNLTEEQRKGLEKLLSNIDLAKKIILPNFQTQFDNGSLNGPSGMEEVLELMDLYCRSALGNTAKYVSAMAFANFYISEIETRYTTTHGTGIATDKMKAILDASYPPKEDSNSSECSMPYCTNATVTNIVNRRGQVDVSYNFNGQRHLVSPKYVVFSAQLGLAPQIIKDMAKKSPQQAKLMKNLGYSHYSVHTVITDGHPYRASYDTWVHNDDKNLNDKDKDKEFTDFILGRWVADDIKGFAGMKDFKTKPPEQFGIFTIYHPLDQEWMEKKYDKQEAQELAQSAVQRLEKTLASLPPELNLYDPTEMNIVRIETNRWPFSVHIAKKGHYIHDARILRKHFGRVYFGNNNLGAPAFEEALFRGHCAADNILKREGHGFQVEEWSRCPIDR